MNKFDEAASSWDKKDSRLLMASKFAKEVSDLIKGKGYTSAFEYGCGTGNVSFALKDEFETVTLADSSQGMIDELAKKIEKEKAAHFNAELINLEDDQHNAEYDVVYTLMAMHHVKEVDTVMEKFERILKPGGMLIIGDLETEDGNFHPYPENQDVHHGFEREFLEKVLTEKKLDFNEYDVFHEIERTHTGTPKMYGLFVLSAIKR